MTDQLAEVWDQLKLSISFSSSAFYEKIKTIEASGLENLDPKVRFTIWKYFNRSKFRGTPYGSFASFAVAELMEGAQEVVFSSGQHLHRFKDWSYRNEAQVSAEDLTSPDRLYFSNSSTYATSRSIRFISLQEQVFELAEIEKSEFINELLEYCSQKAKYAAICGFAENREVSEEVLKGILKAMLDLQLLFTDLDPNIIGPDYFNRTSQPLSETQEQYLIAERTLHSGGLDKAALKHLPSCIEYLTKHSILPINEGLNTFVSAFQKRFEGQELSLVWVLDPELGIGYGDLAGSSATSGLANELAEGAAQQDPFSVPRTEFAHQLLKEMLRTSTHKNQTIQLEKISHNSQENSGIRLPNTFSALVRLADDLLIMESVGGCTSNALTGRFTMASDAVTSHCREITAIESAANPEVIFFDIAYMAEGKVDNVNRRKGIYEYEVPILNYSCADQVIPLNDILVTVKNGEIILLSAQYRKRLIPRLASAYNYSRSDLSIYRFLCDLQHQQLQTQVLFDIQSLLPDLDFYPRVQYKNLVLSLRKWRVKAEDQGRKSVLNLLDEMGVSRYFSAGTGDQTLCFDQESETDIIYFEQYLDQYNDFVITEVIMPVSQIFNDDNGKNYFTQVLVSLNHNEQLYSGHVPAKKTAGNTLEKVIVPGKDWLYFEIYCHEERADFILAGLTENFITSYAPEFKTWFFIRYNDPAPHLRLRLQLKQPENGYFYMRKLMELLSEDLSDGLITDIQLKTYQRETARYGLPLMELTEQHFRLDSEYALSLIAEDPDLFDKYANCVVFMKSALVAMGLNIGEETMFIRSIQQVYEKEHHMTSIEFKKVNREWNAFREVYPQGSLAGLKLRLPAELLSSFARILSESNPEQRKSLYCSLFHMHINRLFASHQRAHETIIYSFLYKQLATEKQNLGLVQLNR